MFSFSELLLSFETKTLDSFEPFLLQTWAEEVVGKGALDMPA